MLLHVRSILYIVLGNLSTAFHMHSIVKENEHEFYPLGITALCKFIYLGLLN